MEVGVWDGNNKLTVSLTLFLLSKSLTYFLKFLLSKWYIKFLPFVAKSYHLLPTGTIRLPGQNVALPNRDDMSPGTKCRPFEQQNNGDIGRHIVPATYCPGTIYVLGQNVAGQNVS